MFAERTIVVGVTGGIAAYKAAEIVSRLTKQGAKVFVIMTESATKLVAPLTFRSLSANPVYVDMWAEPKIWNVEHIALAERAELFLIAPCTANVIGKIAGGIADDMLTTTVMATQAPVVIAPAMNVNMYGNPIVQGNLAKLRGLGYDIIEPDEGRLACGTYGRGRLPEPERIVAHCGEVLARSGALRGRTVLITAGATREPFDPFRFISNPSTGKMGYAVAAEAQRRGAKVILVSAHAEVAPPPGVETVAVGTTAEMLAACVARAPEADIIIGAAAASDFRPAEYSPQKIKKSEAALTVQLERTPDVLATIGAAKRDDQVLVAFSAETADLEQNARAKLSRKHADLIIANDISRPGAGFAVDTNIATLLWANGRREELAQMSKQEMAGIIVDHAAALLTERNPGR